MDDSEAQDSRVKWILLALVAAVVLAGAGWWYWHRDAAGKAPVAAASSAAADEVKPAGPPAEIRHPLTTPDAAAADAPAAAESADPDAAVAARLNSLSIGQELAAWLIPDRLVRRLVATTDNLSRNAPTEQLRPLRAPAGSFNVQREVLDAVDGTERITLAPQNAARYDAPVALLSRMDMQQAAQVYRRLYPLLQKAWEDLGYPNGYFNDRVVDTIDHLLATPEPAGPLLLEQPKVLFHYADAGLEARSSGQKLLLRMGPAHARTVKQKMREFRGWISSKE